MALFPNADGMGFDARKFFEFFYGILAHADG
jgi:hypothetical protein